MKNYYPVKKRYTKDTEDQKLTYDLWRTFLLSPTSVMVEKDLFVYKEEEGLNTTL